MSETKGNSFFGELDSKNIETWKRLKDGLIQRKYDELTTSAPELDPQNPQFDPEKFKAATEKQVSEIVENLSVTEKALYDITTSATVTAAEQFENAIKEPLQQVSTSLTALYGSKSAEALIRIVNIAARALNVKLLVDVQPFLKAELNKPEYEGKQINELSPELQTQALTNARKALSAAADKEESAEDLPILTVTGKGAEKLEHPLDKLNSKVWALFEEADSSGQITMAFSAEKKGSKKQADILYSVNFDDLEESGLNVVKRITVFDKRVQLATNALFHSTGELMTISQIYATMGYSGRPGKSDINRIYTSLEKMRLIPISVDNTSVHKIYPNIKKFVYNGVMLPWESVDAIVNGQRAEGVIHLFREPPLVSLAKSQKQITTIPRALLASPINKTDNHLLIDDYLITRISRLKKSGGKVSNKLLFSTIFSKIGITTRLQKNRSKETIMKYLDHYKECGFIKGYKTAADGVNILY